jgi:hypothetical protein
MRQTRSIALSSSNSASSRAAISIDPERMKEHVNPQTDCRHGYVHIQFRSAKYPGKRETDAACRLWPSTVMSRATIPVANSSRLSSARRNWTPFQKKALQNLRHISGDGRIWQTAAMKLFFTHRGGSSPGNKARNLLAGAQFLMMKKASIDFSYLILPTGPSTQRWPTYGARKACARKARPLP